jgi:hypothetical protein
MSNGHGGKRPGAGRKRGNLSKRTTEILQADAASGEIMPVEVLLFAMRHHFAAQRYDDAASIARDAAPYCHPRLSAVAVSGGESPVRLELVEEIVHVNHADGPQTNGEAAPCSVRLPPE